MALVKAWDSPKLREKGQPPVPLERLLEGLRWLESLQNRDGGWPTFCRGWGKLPFDRSGVDLTAHALRAIASLSHKYQRPLSFADNGSQLKGNHRQGLDFLIKNQQPDGSWIPLWFGNQDHPAELNPTYGTAKVLFAFRDCGGTELPAFTKGIDYLIKSQAADGSWGGPNGGDGGSAGAIRVLKFSRMIAARSCARSLMQQQPLDATNVANAKRSQRQLRYLRTMARLKRRRSASRYFRRFCRHS
jgi:hypothetical protein